MHYNAINGIRICSSVSLWVNFKHMAVDRKQTRRFKSDTKDVNTIYYRKPPQLKAHFNSLLFV